MSYAKLGDYLKFALNEYQIKVCFKDYCGFIPINKELDATLTPYLAHINPFCMYIKQDKKMYWRCLTMIRKSHDKFNRGHQQFSGICHMGLKEYVLPIQHDGNLLGSINIGFFPTNNEKTKKIIRRSLRNSALSTQTALELYERHIVSPKIEAEKILPAFELMGEYLAYTYKDILKTHNVSKSNGRQYVSNEDDIITHAVQIIHERYDSQMTVGDLASMCHCSESHLSRVFKRRKGININNYINKIRVEYAKVHLSVSEKTITEVSLLTGFSDPNYFSRVFKDMTGLAPSEYRRRSLDKPQSDNSLV